MANNLDTNPIYLDTFTADIDISLVPITVKSITFKGSSSKDEFVCADVNGVKNVNIVAYSAGDTRHIELGGQKLTSLVYDFSESHPNSGNVVLIYLA